jgi:hypothetical protein
MFISSWYPRRIARRGGLQWLAFCFFEKDHNLPSPGADSRARLPADVSQWLAHKDKIVSDRYDFVTIYSVKNALDQPRLIQKIMYQLFPAFHAIFTRKTSLLVKHHHRHQTRHHRSGPPSCEIGHLKFQRKAELFLT